MGSYNSPFFQHSNFPVVFITGEVTDRLRIRWNEKKVRSQEIVFLSQPGSSEKIGSEKNKRGNEEMGW
jgi:hypothetical protein